MKSRDRILATARQFGWTVDEQGDAVVFRRLASWSAAAVVRPVRWAAATPAASARVPPSG